CSTGAAPSPPRRAGPGNRTARGQDGEVRVRRALSHLRAADAQGLREGIRPDAGDDVARPAHCRAGGFTERAA
ncbi:unnamed protein product, partial [Prorocentrum cordatum]